MTRFLVFMLACGWIGANPPRAIAQDWIDAARAEFTRTDFTRHSVALDEIRSGGPGRDDIPPIDRPSFRPLDQVTDLVDTEPVIGLVVGDDARAYPLRIMTWHEIVNDVVGGVPVAVTFCPLCNTALVFDRRHSGHVLDFGTTGRLRHSDLVMYDRQTESWWQQFLGEAIIGALTGARLAMLPARLESFAEFRARARRGQVLVPTGAFARPYGANPYAGYDSSARPFLYDGPMPAEIAPLARVVRVGDQAWSLDLLRQKRLIETGDLRLTWRAGQNSALDQPAIADGFDVGSVQVERRADNGWRDAVHSVDFAFAFRAFYPDGVIHVD
jgi:hypothetical protein